MSCIPDIAKRIRNLRIRRGLTQSQVAEALGISQSHYGNVERGDRHLFLEHFIAICNLFACDANSLLQDSLIVFKRTEESVERESTRLFFFQTPVEYDCRSGDSTDETETDMQK